MLGLSLMAIFHAFFQAFPVLIYAPEITSVFGKLGSDPLIMTIFSIGFIVLSFGCVNLINIYFASAGWEMIYTKQQGRVKYFLIGLIGTISYISVKAFSFSSKILFPIQLLEQTVGGFIASLGTVLIFDFFIRIILKRAPKPSEKRWSSLCWLLGSLTGIIVQLRSGDEFNSSLIAAISASILTFLFIVLCKETVWSIKHLR
jgi:hypothetical protein